MKQSSWHAERFLNHALFDILPHTCILQVSDNSHILQVSAIAIPQRIEPTPARARNISNRNNFIKVVLKDYAPHFFNIYKLKLYVFVKVVLKFFKELLGKRYT